MARGEDGVVRTQSPGWRCHTIRIAKDFLLHLPGLADAVAAQVSFSVVPVPLGTV